MAQAPDAAELAANSTQGRITRPRFAQVPIALLEACADRKGTLFVYAWLWHYAGQDDQAFPSINRLALECRMKPEDVRASLRWLVENGWITRVDRQGQTTLFHVRYEQTPPPKGVPLPQKGDTPKGVGHPSPKRGRGPLPQKGYPNKRDLTRGIEQQVEPPLPPSGGSACEDQREPIAAEPLLPITSPPSPPAGGIVAEPPPPEPKPVKPRKPRFKPSQDLIPVSLLPVAPEILGFWATKAGAKSEQAWQALISQLTLILDDPMGGAEPLRSQLQTGIDRAPIKPWMSVTYANWKQFGPRPGAGNRLTNRRQTQDEAAAAAVAYIRARKARKAAAAGGMASQQTVLCEVIR